MKKLQPSKPKLLIHKANTKSSHMPKTSETFKVTVQILSPKHHKSNTVPYFSTPCTTHASSSCSDDPILTCMRNNLALQKVQQRPDDFIEPVPDLSIPSTETYNRFKTSCTPCNFECKAQKLRENLVNKAKSGEKPRKKFKIMSKQVSACMTSRGKLENQKNLEKNKRIVTLAHRKRLNFIN